MIVLLCLRRLWAGALLATEAAEAALEALADAATSRVLTTEGFVVVGVGLGTDLRTRAVTDGNGLAAQALGHERVHFHFEQGVNLLALAGLVVALNRVRGFTLALEVIWVVILKHCQQAIRK